MISNTHFVTSMELNNQGVHHMSAGDLEAASKCFRSALNVIKMHIPRPAASAAKDSQRKTRKKTHCQTPSVILVETPSSSSMDEKEEAGAAELDSRGTIPRIGIADARAVIADGTSSETRLPASIMQVARHAILLRKEDLARPSNYIPVMVYNHALASHLMSLYTADYMQVTSLKLRAARLYKLAIGLRRKAKSSKLLLDMYILNNMGLLYYDVGGYENARITFHHLEILTRSRKWEEVSDEYDNFMHNLRLITPERIIAPAA